MKQQFIFIISLFLLSASLYAQTTIKGKITDATTGEQLIGATVLVKDGVGTATDFDGNFSIKIDKGTYDIKFSFVGYETTVKTITVANKTITINAKLETSILNEIVVVGDIARTRETPVAFTNVSPAKLEEELASQDIPMILNSTPGVYATQQGGGDGDARINIRGFNQRNVAVMLDGVPVNDMENGWVYWSNWFGLDAVTRTIQVQRGLSASKLALPSVGGTVNIITKGIDAKRSANIQQEVGNDGFLRTSLGYTSGKMKNGWGFTMAGSYKRGNGWVDETWTQGWFYFARIDKKIGNHLLSISAMGAPQSHGQRSYKQSIETYDKEYARDLFEGNSELYSLMSDENTGSISREEFNFGLSSMGLDSVGAQKYYSHFIDTVGAKNRGVRYNQHWGKLDRIKVEGDDTLRDNSKPFSERVNQYYKPQFTFKDFWIINDKLSLSNIAYLSIGKGGGMRLKSSSGIAYDEDEQMNFQTIYNKNSFSPYLINPSISTTERMAGNYMRKLVNDHFWYGLLTTLNYSVNSNLSFSGGFDLRSYKGEHYEEVYDLLGADYAVDTQNRNQSSDVKREGDVSGFHNDGLVRWGGLFFQSEYKNNRLSAFVNLTTAITGYKRIDYFMPKELHVGDTTLQISYGETVNYNGNAYTQQSSGVDYASVGWKYLPGFTAKAGANFNLTDNMNIFFNTGYLSKAPRFSNVYYYDNVEFTNLKNEIVTAIELGYSVSFKKIAANFNFYNTNWVNKPFDSAPTIKGEDDEEFKVNINGMNAIHKGIEFDFAYHILHNLEFQGLLSIGDWIWNTADSLGIYDDNQNFRGNKYFNTKGIHVGDAAQQQYGATIRYEPIKRLYVKAKITYFGKYYSQFDPITLEPDSYPKSFEANGDPKDSWQIPDYYLVDIHAGYGFKLGDYRLKLKINVLNVFDKIYIADAQNNDQYSGQVTNSFDARSASVFFGMGRRFTASLKIQF